MKLCPQCEAGYPNELNTCPLHGGLLSPLRELKPGMMIRNTYRIQRKISEGNMAQIYLAQHVLLNEAQVLKFLSPELSSDKAWTSRFLREVRAMRQIRHKNVVRAGNLEPAEDGTLFFSMEYVEGLDLHEFYRRAPKPFDVGLALEIVHEIAQGLGAAHEVGVVHRDIKPENILIAIENDSLVPKIADFGIVATCYDSRLTQNGDTLLTPQFAAPEQWMSDTAGELDGRTDLYALGGLLFELLTGQSAFHADNYRDWAQQHLHSKPPVPSDLRTELEAWRGLDDLVLRLLAKNPADRPKDAAEVVSLIEGIGQLPVSSEAVQINLQQEIPASVVDPTLHEVEMFQPEPRTTRSEQSPSPRHRARIVTAASSQPALTENSNFQFLGDPVTARSGHAVPWIAGVAALSLVAIATSQFTKDRVPVEVLTSQKQSIFAVSLAPNGIDLASASRDGTVQYWNLRNHHPLGAIPALTTSIAFSPDGHALATGMADNSINLWDTATNSVLLTMSGHTGAVKALAFSPDGKELASASSDKTVIVWDVTSGRMFRVFRGNSAPLLALAFSPDGQFIAAAGTDSRIGIWSATQDAPVRTLEGHTQSVNALTFSPDGRSLASASDDGTIRLWNLGGRPTTRMLKGHSGAVFSLSFSPDGRRLVSGGADHTVRLWDPSSGKLLRTLKGHDGPVLSVAFSPLNDVVASSSSDQTIRLWAVSGVRP